MEETFENLYADRHASVAGVAQFFTFDHLPPFLQPISQQAQDLAAGMLRVLPSDNAELTTGLRKLLEAKDCFVRAALLDNKNES